MGTHVVNTRLMISAIIIILTGFIGTTTAEIILSDCPSDTDRPVTQLGYAHSYFDSSTNTMTYLLDTSQDGNAEILEYCVYPDPGFTGMTSDLTPLYNGWSIDRPGTKSYFGFDSRSADKIPLDGSTDILIGKAKYVDGPPSSELILLHVSSEGWTRASTSPLPPPIPTATPTVSPTDTATPTVSPTDTATPTVSPTDTATPTVSPTDTATSTVSPTDTVPIDSQPPTIPLCPVAIVEGQTTINLSWQPSTDNVGIAKYIIYRSVDNVNFYQIATTTNTNYVNTELTTGTTYYYTIKAIDTSNNPSGMSEMTYATPRDISPPIVTVPSDIMAEATSSNGAIVTFSASANDDIDGSITPICFPSSGSTFHMSLTTVTCSATDNSGNVGSTIFTITIVDTIAPTPPSELVATAMGISRIDLSWTASYDAVGVSQYLIYRSTDNINFIPIGTTIGTTFQSTGLNSDTMYYYYIIALDREGHRSDNSNLADARTLILPTPGPTSTSTPGPGPSPGPTSTPEPTPVPNAYPVITVPLSMTQEATSPSGATVTFSASATDPEDGNIPVICDPPSGSTFAIGSTTVVCTATDSTNNTASNTFIVHVVDTIAPTSPIGLITTTISTSRIDLSWSSSYDAVGVKTYWIFRSLDGTNFVPIGSTTGTTFSNNGLLQNTTYYYVVVAFDAASNPSDPGNVASARTLQQLPNPPPIPGPSYYPTDTGTPGPLPTDTQDPCSPNANTQIGQIVEVTPEPSVGVRFDAVLACGDTTAVAYYENQWIPLPNNYKSILFYDIDTTSTYSNSITIQVTYSGTPSGINENSIRLFHYENGNWVDVTTSLDTTSNVVKGVVSSLSPFGLGGTGSTGTGGSGYTTVKGYSFDIVGLIMLGLCLGTISISRLRGKEKTNRK